MAISQLNARSIFTTEVSQIYEDKVMPRPLFMSIANETTTTARYVSTEVRRYDETVAADILRGTNGNRNQFTRSTQKLYEPPQYNENFDLTTLEIYDRAFGAPSVSANVLADLIDEAGEKAAFLKGKIMRAQELQWIGVFDTGIITTLVNGDNVDFRRKAASMVDHSSNYWNTSNTQIIRNFREGCNYLRTEGKAMGGEFIAVVGEDAFDAFLASEEILNLGDQTYVQRVEINMPSDMMNGGVYHGTISAGSYKVHLYTYPEYYTAANGTETPYWPKNKVCIFPKSGFVFTTKYAGIQALFKGNASMPEYYGYVDDKYFLNNYIDQRTRSHVFEVLSAPLAVPLSVDQIFTMQVLA